MDPITHGLVGAAVTAFSGTAVAMDNPLTIGAMLGAMSPDLDFVIRLFKDDAAYLEHHRGLSHTVPFLIGFSVAISVILSQVGFINFNFLTTLLWTFIGALSHTGLDILNSYGAKLFKKKHKFSLLTLYDPVITLVGLVFILNGQNTLIDLISGSLIVSSYLLLRHRTKLISAKMIDAILSEKYDSVSVTVMPSLKAFYKWDFVAHTLKHDIVGQYNPFLLNKTINQRLKILQILEIQDHGLLELFKSSQVGKVFGTFSPNLHIQISDESKENQLVLRAIDLRYYFKESFMHHATLVLDQEKNVVSSFLHPYHLSKSIPVFQN